MLNFVYYTISAILWFWHKAFGLFLDPASGVTWALAIILLVVTLRILLFRPMLKQQRSAIKMQQMQPQMQAIRKKYANDQQAQALEMRKLQKEMGVNPLAGCIPMLVQIPVFIGLFHVLRSFNRTGEGMGMVGLSVEENWNTPNYIFGVDEVRSFLEARIFGAPLAGSIGMGEDQYAAFTAPGTPVDFGRMDIIVVAVPLILISAFATHMNARISVERTRRRQEEGFQQRAEGMMGQQMDMMNKMMLWFIPIMILVSGAIWHIGLLVYMLTNNVWTFFQQKYIFKKLDQEEREEREAEQEAKRISQQKLAPKVGQKPVNPKKGGKKAQQDRKRGDFDLKADAPADGDATAQAGGTAAQAAADPAPSKPKPGAKPAGSRKKKRKR
ncbi:membrane protein insertase YidC [Corynebacterium sp. 335C]